MNLSKLIIFTLSSLQYLKPDKCKPKQYSPEYRSGFGIKSLFCRKENEKAFERSITDFIPLLPKGGDIKVGVIDYVTKIVGGVVTFGLIAIALRRRFERRYRH